MDHKITPSSDHQTTSSPLPLMMMTQARSSSEPETEEGSTTRTAETLLRLIPIAPCIAALVVMLHNSQTNDFGSVSYSHLPAFKYLVHVNGVCGGYSLLSAVIAAVPRPFKMSQAWTFFILDNLMTYLLLAAAAVSTEVLYLAFNGDAAITWSSACSSFPAFCHKATASVIVTFAVVACYAVLSLVSAFKLFANYDAPHSSQDKPTPAAFQLTSSFHA